MKKLDHPTLVLILLVSGVLLMTAACLMAGVGYRRASLPVLFLGFALFGIPFGLNPWRSNP